MGQRSPAKGGGAVTVYQALTLMIAFASLVVTIIALTQKK
ncbi:putative holin-like toxin [Bacillus sp. FJAT-27251]